MTQEYTPVQWEDETPTTPGTLINKARLDQMQTAHHYADGFEEVDAVPTADPGVDYHKVVFCTADTTFYRWDGSAWVKDVDDTTKALLEAHEADHSNPHVVTKAQVGLGNCDNTSDADKPVSTAQQTALDGKVAIIPVTSGVKFYSQSSGGTSLYQGTSSPVTGITSVPMRDSSGRIKTAAPSANDDAANKKYVDDADALKLNSSALVSAWQGTPDDDHIPTEKLVSNTLATKVDKLTTTGTYAYTHASGTQGEVAINEGAVASTLASRDANAYLTAATNATGTKDNVLTTGTRVQNDLDNYSPMVRTTNAQTIAGVKTLTDAPIIYGDGLDYQSIALKNKKFTTVATDMTGGTNTSLMFTADNNGTLARLRYRSGQNKMRALYADLYKADGTALVTTLIEYDGVNDILSVPVHTTGNETMAGTKTFTTNPVVYTSGFSEVGIKSSRISGNIGGITTYNSNNDIVSQIFTNVAGSLTIKLFTASAGIVLDGQRAYNAGNTTDVATIGTLDNYTPMVRTTDNQTIAGVKDFTSVLKRTDGGTTAIETQTKMTNLDRTWTGTAIRDFKPIVLVDNNDQECLRIQYRRQGKNNALYAVFTDTTGTEHSFVLASYTEP